MLSWQPATVPEGISLPVSSSVFYSVEAQSPPGMGGWSTLYARHPTPSVKLSDLRPDLDYLVRVRAHYNDYTSEPTLPVYIPRRAGMSVFISQHVYFRFLWFNFTSCTCIYEKEKINVVKYGISKSSTRFSSEGPNITFMIAFYSEFYNHIM